MSQHGGAAICEVAPGVDVEAVDAGTEAGDGAGHLDIVTVHLGEHNPPLNGVSLHDRNSRLGLKSVFIVKLKVISQFYVEKTLRKGLP